MTTFPQSHLRQLILSSDTYILIVSYPMRADGHGRVSTLCKVVVTYYSYVRGMTYLFFGGWRSVRAENLIGLKLLMGLFKKFD